MLGGQAATRDQKTLAPLRNEATIGNFIEIVQQPFDPRLFTRMQSIGQVETAIPSETFVPRTTSAFRSRFTPATCGALDQDQQDLERTAAEKNRPLAFPQHPLHWVEPKRTEHQHLFA
jgi:hypothetical protein